MKDGCERRRRAAAVLQQAHTPVVVADVSGENQEFCFSAEENVCNPLLLIPRRQNECESRAKIESFQRCCCSGSPVSDSILQLIQDSAVQSINIRQLIENLSKPVLVQHRFPFVPDRCDHRFTKVLRSSQTGCQ